MIEEAATPARPAQMLADLAELALAGEPRDRLARRALAFAAEIAEPPVAGFFTPADDRFVLRTGVGFPPGVVGHRWVTAGHRDPVSFAAREAEPVVVGDLESDPRFDRGALFAECEIVSGVFAKAGEFGVLAVLDHRPRRFAPESVIPLESLAATLAVARDRISLQLHLEQYAGLTAAALDVMEEVAMATTLESAMAIAVGRVRQQLGWPLAFALRHTAHDRLGGCGVWSDDGGDRGGMRAYFEASRVVDPGGLSRVLAAGRTTWIDLDHAAETPCIAAARAAGCRGNACTPIIVDGRVEATLNFLSAQHEAPPQMLLDVCDTLARQIAARASELRSQSARHASEARFRGLFEASDLGIAVLDLQGHIEEANAALAGMLGYTVNELVGRRFTEFSAPVEAKAHHARFLDLVERRTQSFDVEHHFRRSDGLVTTVHMVINVVRDGLGRPLHAVGMALDRSEQQRLRREVAEAAWREQRRLARVLHDDLAQVLTGSTLIADALERRLRRGDSAEAGTAAQLATGLHHASAALRALVDVLEPVSPAAGGLGGALEALVVRLQSEGGAPACRLLCDGDLSVPDEVAYRLYRVAQMAVTDAVHHAEATEVWVSASRHGDRVELLVEDNGDRDADHLEGRRLDLEVVRHEADLAGGRVAVSPRDPGGATLRCVVPV